MTPDEAQDEYAEILLLKGTQEMHRFIGRVLAAWRKCDEARQYFRQHRFSVKGIAEKFSLAEHHLREIERMLAAIEHERQSAHCALEKKEE